MLSARFAFARALLQLEQVVLVRVPPDDVGVAQAHRTTEQAVKAARRDLKFLDGVRAVGRPHEPFAAFEPAVPGCIILDLLMPVMDGMTFLDRLRASPYHAGLPVIVVTAKDLTPRERDELAEKASGVIAKGDGVEDRLREVLGALFPIGEPQR